LTGLCSEGSNANYCPVYYLYNWRWMKSHLYEVGPITSSVLVRPGFFAYESGVYSAFGAANTDREGSLSNVVDGTLGAILGLLDVTIIGWGQQQTNLSTKVSPKALYNRWWYVIPHMGTDFGENCTDIFGARFETADETASIECPGGENGQSGLMRWARRVDDSNIESRAVGAVPYNFSPLTELTPKPTGKKPYG
jgi:hypothetical protein